VHFPVSSLISVVTIHKTGRLFFASRKEKWGVVVFKCEDDASLVVIQPKALILSQDFFVSNAGIYKYWKFIDSINRVMLRDS